MMIVTTIPTCMEPEQFAEVASVVRDVARQHAVWQHLDRREQDKLEDAAIMLDELAARLMAERDGEGLFYDCC